MNIIKNVRWLFVGILLIGGCQDGPQAGPSDPPAQPPSSDEVGPAVVGPERQLGLVNHAVLAFRPQDGLLVGGYRTHQAAIGDGIVAITPYTFEGGERRGHLAMSLETTAITSDGELVAGALSSTELDDGGVVLRRGDVEERLRNLEDGLHQEWSFSTPPPSGDLVVDVAVSGYRYTEATPGGLHFVSSDGVGLRYSHATWIDSHGEEWPITAVYDDGRIRLTVPDSVIAGTTFPAVLDPTIGTEVALDAPVVGPTGATQMHPAIAFNGTNYLVVWSDNRDSADADIWGTRLSAAGAILDPLGLKIAATAGVQSHPTVAYNGTTFLVAWEDFKVTDGAEADIAAATVSSAGAVTQLGAVAATGANETSPVLAARSDGNALLVWNAAGAVNGAIFSGSFGAATAIASGALVEKAGVAANPGGSYLVSWSAGTDLHGQFVTTAGALSGAAFNISAAVGNQFASAATFDGTNYDVVWENNNAGLNLYGARVSTAGAVLDTRLEGATTVGGVAISTAADNQEAPTIACQASGCLVTWQDRRNNATTGPDVFGQLVNLNFTLNGSNFAISNASGAQFAPVVGSTGGAFLVAWFDFRDTNAFTIFGSPVSSAGAVSAAAIVGTGNNRETAPALGRAGANFGLFWSDSRTVGGDIRFTRFNPSGGKLDSTPLIGTNATFAQFNPSASTDLGTNTFVVWSDTRNGANKDVFGARVDLASGTNLDAAGIALSTAAGDQLAAVVASSGSVALVVWQDRRNGTFDIFGTIVNSAGAVVVPEFAISTAASDQTHPGVAWDAASGQFIVVWADQRAGTTVDIFGSRVSTAGAVLDPAGVVISTAANPRFAPAIASTPTITVAVWQDRRNAPAGGYNIYGTRLRGGASLQVLDPAGIKVSNNPGRQSAPAIGSLGTGFVVVWSDDRAGQSDIFGQQLSSSGTLTGAEFGVATSTDAESAPTVLGAAGTGNNLRVAYEVTRQSTVRIATRLIGTQFDNGSTCSSAATCASGFCVDGVCCESACSGNHVPGDCHGCSNRVTGQANGLCRAIGPTSICRGNASTTCDVREYCDGVSFTCGPDIGQKQGQVCNKNTNTPPGTGTGICPSNAAPGPHACI